ncbi:MAG: phosphate acyltransferase PlsX [Rhizobacter sp.]|nr:phosphate acyltransferase PlsX [Chlorobiales bacterium]
MKIAVDAMGGDFAPENVIAGVALALQHSGGRFEMVLTGIADKVQPLLESHGLAGKVELIDTPDVIEMHESASVAVKTKQNSSMVRGLTLCKEGKADGFVSMGNTGAQMAASLLVLGRIDGVSRPTIGSYFPNLAGMMMIFDVGANVDVKPEHLAQFAEMGSIYQHFVFKIDKPTVGLLNIGEEESKGTDTAKQTYKLLTEAHRAGRINFTGNIEGRDILKGKVSIVLCDGFTGNIILKFGESVPQFLADVFKPAMMKEIQAGKLSQEAAGTFSKLLKETLRNFDDEEYGGVPLLGVNGISIIGHGKSSAKAIMNAIFRAEEMAQHRINERIAEALKVSA